MSGFGEKASNNLHVDPLEKNGNSEASVVERRTPQVERRVHCLGVRSILVSLHPGFSKSICAQSRTGQKEKCQLSLVGSWLRMFKTVEPGLN